MIMRSKTVDTRQKMNNTVGKTFGRLAATVALALLGAGAAGCGQTSFFEVTVQVKSDVTGVRQACLSVVGSCEVTVSGAASEGPFTLANCDHVTSWTIGTFQYGTDAESGTVNFHIDMFDANLKKPPLGSGDASGSIKAGGRQPVTLSVTPTLASFMASGGCS
jgi:hypothetical protein